MKLERWTLPDRHASHPSGRLSRRKLETKQCIEAGYSSVMLDDSTLTDLEQATRFVRETGVDALAVSIGNAHGISAKLPVFDFDRLTKIRLAGAAGKAASPAGLCEGDRRFRYHLLRR